MVRCRGGRSRLVAGLVIAASLAWTPASASVHIPLIDTFAGTGLWSWSGENGDGQPAAQANLLHPDDVAVDGQGNVYIADNADYRVRKVSASGIMSTLAGIGRSEYGGDGGDAASAGFAAIGGIAADAAGNVYVSDLGRVRKIATSGIITTIAGTGERNISGDGGPASEAQTDPGALAVDRHGNIYVAEVTRNVVRKIDAAGIIRTVAGTGAIGSSGDGGPATSATLTSVKGLAVDQEDNLYIACWGRWDPATSRYTDAHVRMVAPSGIISTIAGNGDHYFSGDGGIATEAGVAVLDVAVDRFGNVYVSGGWIGYGTETERAKRHARIRMVDRFGRISTLAGTASFGFSGDGGSAIDAELGGATGLAFDAAGDLLIADPSNMRVRKVTLAPGDCGDAALVGIRGSGEGATELDPAGRHARAIGATLSDPSGPWGFELFDDDATPDGVIGIGYETVDVTPGVPASMTEGYEASIEEGAGRLEDTISWLRRRCGDLFPVLVVGYSQGADVVQSALESYARNTGGEDWRSLAGVALLGSPRFSFADPSARGTFVADIEESRGGVFGPTVVPERFRGMARTYCVDDDAVCSSSASNGLRGNRMVRLSSAHQQGYDVTSQTGRDIVADVSGSFASAILARDGAVAPAAPRGALTAYRATDGSVVYVSAASLYSDGAAAVAYRWDIGADGSIDEAGARPYVAAEIGSSPTELLGAGSLPVRVHVEFADGSIEPFEVCIRRAVLGPATC